MDVRKINSQILNIGENVILSCAKKLTGTYKLHWHDFFEIELFVSGSGTHILNGEESPLSRGVVFLLTPNDFHEIRCDGRCEVLNIQFLPSAVEQKMLWQISDPFNNYGDILSESSYTELYLLMKALSVNETTDIEFRKKLLHLILTILVNNRKATSKKHIEKFSSDVVGKAKLYMSLHFRNNPSLEEIAKYVGLNPNYFCRVFMKETEQTPISYINELKLNYAKSLLLSSSLTVTEIAFACGYGSLSNFLKAFKKQYNISPSQLRK